MKKFAYTLAEVLIAVCIVGVISAILIGLLNKAAPDTNKIRYLKTYDALTKAVKTMSKNSSLYSEMSEVVIPDDLGNPLYKITLNLHKYPLIDTNKPTNPDFQDDIYSGAPKFGNLLKVALNGKTPDSGVNCDFVTPDNARWTVNTVSGMDDDYPLMVDENGVHGIYKFYSKITVDINGAQKPNQSYNQNMQNTPDIFMFGVTANGKVKALDAYGRHYLKTRRSLSRKKVSLTNENSNSININSLGVDIDINILKPSLTVYKNDDDDEDNDDQNGDDPNGDDPNGDDPNGDDPNGDDPNGDDPNGDDPNGGFLPIIHKPGWWKPWNGHNPPPINPNLINNDGEWSNVSGSDLAVPSVAQMTQALSNSHNTAVLLSSNWYEGDDLDDAGTFRSAAKATLNSIIDELYEDILGYYLNSFVSESVKSQLTVNHDVIENEVFKARLEYTKETLKRFYAKVIDSAELPYCMDTPHFTGEYESSNYSFYDYDYIQRSRTDKWYSANLEFYGTGDLDALENWLLNGVMPASTPRSGIVSSGIAVGQSGLILLTDSERWFWFEDCHAKYAINKNQLKQRFMDFYSSYAMTRDYSNNFWVQNGDPSDISSQFTGMYRLGNDGNGSGDYYYECSNAVSDAKSAMNTLLNNMKTKLTEAGYPEAAVTSAVSNTKTYYDTLLTRIGTMNGTIEDYSSGQYVKTISGVTPTATFGAIVYGKVKTCDSKSGVGTGTSGILVRCSTNWNTSWRIDVDKSKVFNRVLQKIGGS